MLVARDSILFRISNFDFCFRSSVDDQLDVFRQTGPPFNVVASLVPTGAMLLFPAWFKPGEMRGIEGGGTALLMLFMQIGFLGLAMVFPALAAIGLFFLVQMVAPGPAAIIAGALTGAVLLARIMARRARARWHFRAL